MDQTVSGATADIGGCRRAADWLRKAEVDPDRTGAYLLGAASVAIRCGEAKPDSTRTDRGADK